MIHGVRDRLESTALARCVRVTADRFAAEYWGRRPLLSPGVDLPGRFRDLMSVTDVDELISRRGLRTPFLRMARDGRVLRPRDYTGPGGTGAEVADQALDERVLAGFADGATLVLQGLHRTWPAVGDFARTLAEDLGHPVGVNGYVTPPEAQGFAAHYDTHDVFVLQVQGSKHWQVHRPVVADPLAQGRTDEIAAATDGPPVLDTALEPGDALYLPRGWVHSARSHRELTMHLTVGVFPVTRYTLVRTLLSLAADHPELRRSLPLGVDPADPADLAGELAVTIQVLADWLRQVDPGAVADHVREAMWPKTRPAPIAPLAQASTLRSLDADTRVARRGQLRWQLAGRGDAVLLRLFDRDLSFPASWRSALRAVLDGNVDRVGDLPGLDRKDQLALARQLLRAAVVVPVERGR